MTTLQALLLTAFLSAILIPVLGTVARKFTTLFALVGMGLLGYFYYYTGNEVSEILIGKWVLIWEMTAYGRLFAGLVVVLGFFSVMYSYELLKSDKRSPYYYLLFFLTVMGMLGITVSQDWLSLFIFWEIMTWSSFLMVLYRRESSHEAAIKYFIISAIGAYAILVAILVMYPHISDFSIAGSIANFDSLTLDHKIWVVVLFILGFGVKAAMMPVHVWAPDAYPDSPNAFTPYFSGVLSKMGIFGIALVVLNFSVLFGFGETIRWVLSWLGGLTALFATFYAVFQTDAKKLLAYSSIAQLGYIIIGIAVGTPLSVAAAFFLTILHAVFKGMLFMAVGGIEHRTGTRDLNSVSGLIRKMPFSFFTVLLGIITVAGVPPLGGFTAKWLLYEALIADGRYFLVIVVFAASTAAFLYLYRIIFSLFLGQEEPEFENVKEVHWTMVVPMVLLSLFTLVSGVFPGILMKMSSGAMTWLGVAIPKYEMSVLFNSWGNSVNMFTVVQTIAVIFLTALVLLTIKGFKNTRYVTTKDIHTAGEIPTENENLTYAMDFYKPFERAIEPVLRYSLNKIYTSIAKALEETFDVLRYIYTGNGQTYALYVVIFLVVLILFSGWILGVQI